MCIVAKFTIKYVWGFDHYNPILKHFAENRNKKDLIPDLEPDPEATSLE
jgi:hypothetical protein